jgi:release factor glutamine methyltransferase
MSVASLERPSTVSQALSSAAQRLASADVDAPRLVAEALLAHTLDLTRAQLLAHPDQTVPPSRLTHYHTLIDRCESGEPFAYVLGHREFYGLDFGVDPRVLIPRPETELLVETAIEIARARSGPLHVADIGTGSGAIAIALAVHLPDARLIAIDISPQAIEVARSNARLHRIVDRIEFRIGDLLAPLREPVDLICANLPYVRSGEWAHLAQSIRRHEPAIAFNGGPDGLGLVHRLLIDAPRVIRSGGSLVLEIGGSQGEAALELARDTFPSARNTIKADYAGLDRLLIIQL